MRKFKYLFTLILVFLFCIGGASAKERFYDLNVSVYINKDGSALITERWHMKLEKGTELYKPMNTTVTNFKVTDEDGNIYTFQNYWDIDASMSEKAYKNGINTSGGVYELCWGKSSYGEHTYTISYMVKDFVFNTNDAQVSYFKLVNDSMDPAPETFSIDISSFYQIPDTLDVWGFGYKGLAYVHGGKALYTDDTYGFNKNQYVVSLIKFPLNTFQTNTTTQYETFQDVLTVAQEGKIDYDYDDSNNAANFFEIIAIIFQFVFWFFFVFVIGKVASSSSNGNYNFGEVGKKINMKEINNFRDIPCDKDLFKAYWFAEVYDINKKKEDVLGSVILKWLLEDQVKTITVPKKLFRKETTAIDMTKDLVTDNPLELEMYNIMKTASKDNILETNELEKWCKNNYSKFFKWFDKVLDSERNKLISKGLIQEEIKGNVFKQKTYIVNPSLKEEAIKLAGLKKFLTEFSLIKEKTPIEVKLWKEYLIYAQIFGIADKVAKTFKDLYPEVLEQTNFDFTDVVIISNISSSSVSAASSARTNAQSYSGGGGGFSSGGGGGGSFGGGSGGGSR